MATLKGWNIEKVEDVAKGKSVAIIGGGPCGLTSAAYLARRGANVCIYDKHDSLRWTISTWHTRI